VKTREELLAQFKRDLPASEDPLHGMNPHFNVLGEPTPDDEERLQRAHRVAVRYWWPHVRLARWLRMAVDSFVRMFKWWLWRKVDGWVQ
jgi:hypothetical protein